MAAAVAVSVALFAGACGASGGDSGGSSSRGTAPGVDTSAKTINLGGWQIASGKLATYKAVHDGAAAYFADVNAKGGINGWKINYDVPDTGSDPARALQSVRNQISGKNVFAFVSGAGSPENAQVTPYIDQQTYPYVSPNDNGDSYLGKGYKTIFPVVPPYSSLVAMDVKYASDTVGAKSFALLYQNDAVGQPVEKKFDKAVANVGGTVAAKVPFDVSDVDFTGAGQKLAGAKPDVVIHVGAAAALVKTKKAAVGAGLNAKWFGPFYAADPSVAALDPTGIEGMYFDNFTAPFFGDTPEIKAYAEALGKYQPAAKVGGLTLLGWTGASVMVAGLQEATKDGKAPTQEALISALETFNGKQLGVIPALTYTSGNHLGISSGYVLQYKDGKFGQVAGPLQLPTIIG